MKTLYLSTFQAIFLSLISYAQPNFTIDDLGSQIGDVFYVDTCPYVDAYAMGGEDENWDFNYLTLGGTIVTFEMVAIEDVVNPLDFAGATMVRKMTYEDSESYFYSSINDNKFLNHGYFRDLPDDIVGVEYENPEEIYSLPMSFGSWSVDTFSATLYSSFDNEGPLTGETSYEVIGYGTLLLNDETYSDVQLMVTNKTFVTDVIIESTHIQNIFSFYKAGYHLPLLTFTHATNESEEYGLTEYTTGSILVQQTSVGIDEINSIDFNIYPNPTKSDEITIQFEEIMQLDMEINLLDPLGRLYKIDDFNRTQNGNHGININLPSGLASGIYHVEITGDNISGSETIIIE